MGNDHSISEDANKVESKVKTLNSKKLINPGSNLLSISEPYPKNSWNSNSPSVANPRISDPNSIKSNPSKPSSRDKISYSKEMTPSITKNSQEKFLNPNEWPALPSYHHNPGHNQQEKPGINTQNIFIQNQVLIINNNTLNKKSKEKEFKNSEKTVLRRFNSKCEYFNCGIAKKLLICTVDNCHKVFCNEIDGKLESHFMSHINMTGHFTIAVYSSSGKQYNIECENCNDNNILNLGFLTSKEKIICKNDLNCITNSKNREAFYSIINLNKILDIVFFIYTDTPNLSELTEEKCKMTQEHLKSNQVPLSINPGTKVNNISQKAAYFPSDTVKSTNKTEPITNLIKKSPFQISKTYPSKNKFVGVFSELLKIEEKEQLLRKVKISYSDIELDFFDKKKFELFLSSLIQENKNLLTAKLENELKEKIRTNDRIVAMTIDYSKMFKFNDLDSVIVKQGYSKPMDANVLKISSKIYFFVFEWSVPKNCNVFEISLRDIQSGFDRVRQELDKFLQVQLHPEITSAILGKKVNSKLNFRVEIEDYTANGMFDLNNSQIEAIKMALNHRVSIIQGPPGTGKTQTISSLVYHIDSLCRNESKRSNNIPKNSINKCNFSDYSNSDHEDFDENFYSYNDMNIDPNQMCLEEYFKEDSKILISATSNNPVFDLRRKLVDKGMKVVQVLSRAKENEYKDEPGTLKYLLDKELGTNREYLSLVSSFEKSKNTLGIASDTQKIERLIYRITKNCESRIIKQHNIVCCTCRTLPNAIFSDINFDFAIIDEATQSLEPDLIVCLLKNVRHLVLVGDIHQLGSVIQSQEAKDLGLDISTIERFHDLGIPMKLLNTQYRMHPLIAEFSKRYFYDNKLFHGKSSTPKFLFPNPINSCIFFYDINSTETKQTPRISYCNKYEAKGVIKLIKYLQHQNFKPENLGIITFYEGQREYIAKRMIKDFPGYYSEKVEVMSVDSSQGREKEIIILSCVRSNRKCKVGFLDDYRRLNVAMTRAKNGLAVCGNVKTLMGSDMWASLVCYFQENNVLYSGEFPNDLKAIQVIRNTQPFVLKRVIKYSDQ